MAEFVVRRSFGKKNSIAVEYGEIILTNERHDAKGRNGKIVKRFDLTPEQEVLPLNELLRMAEAGELPVHTEKKPDIDPNKKALAEAAKKQMEKGP